MCPTGAVDGTTVPRFIGASTFARLPEAGAFGDYEIAILGAPFDGGTSYRPGARFGPMAVRQASRHLRPGYHVELDVSPLDRVKVVDAGDVILSPYDIHEAIARIERRARELSPSGQRLVTIGGDHTVALPMMRAAARHHGPLALIHFDAHLDTWDSYFGESITHGTVFRRAFEEGLLLEEKSIHIGIRGPVYDKLDLGRDAALGFKVIRAGDLDVLGIDGAVDQIRRRVGEAPVYLSVDIDVLDPAFAPGTGTPEMGGLDSRELLHLLRRLQGLNLVGGDVVEVAPAYDHAEITSLAGATVVFDIVALMSRTSA